MPGSSRSGSPLFWIGVAFALFAIPLILLGGSLTLTTGYLPSVQEKSAGPFARSIIPGNMLELYQSYIVKRECPSLSWSIPAAITHVETNDGRYLKGYFGNNPVPRDPLNSVGNEVVGPAKPPPPLPVVQVAGEVPADLTGYDEIGVFTSDDPTVMLTPDGKKISDSIDAVAIRPDLATLEEVQQLKDAGYKIYVWQDMATPEGVAAVAKYGAVGYIAQAEGQAQLDAARAVEGQIKVPKTLVTNSFMGEGNWPPGWKAMPEAYQQVNPNASPDRMTYTTSKTGAKDITPVFGSYDGTSEGGGKVSLKQYLSENEGNKKRGMKNFWLFSGETLSGDDIATLNGQVTAQTLLPEPLQPSAPQLHILDRLGPDQLTIAMWDSLVLQPVIKFRVVPHYTPYGPYGMKKAKDFNNPNNPWDTGHAGNINADIAKIYGWSGKLVDEWDYQAGAPKIYYDDEGRPYTKYVYNPGTNGPLGDRIPYYRVPDGFGYGVDGDGDGDADIMNPYDSVPSLARYLCGHGGDSLTTTLNALFDYRPIKEGWYIQGGLTAKHEQFRGVLPLSKQLTAGGQPLSPEVSASSTGGTYVPGGAPSSVALSEIPPDKLAIYQSDTVKNQCPGLSWTIVAAVMHLESNDGRNNGPSSAGAEGPGQFLPSTWATAGIDGDGDGKADINNFKDAAASVAHYLCSLGASDPKKLPSALYGYNHAWWYVYGGPDDNGNQFEGVLPLAKKLAETPIAGASAGAQPGCPQISLASDANNPGEPVTPETMGFLCQVASVYGSTMVCTTGTNHSYLTVDGKVSDHSSGHACDFGMVANGGTDDGPVGDAMMRACLEVAGDPPTLANLEASQGGLFNRQAGGLRIQCIWKTYIGGNHHNHVHIGARPL